MKSHIKAITVTLCIILFCGGLLAILSDLLHVSTNERIERAISSIYTEEQVSLKEEIDVSKIDMSDLNNVGIIKACYLLSNDDYLVLPTGKKGYSNGSITCYVAVDNSLTVKKVVKDSDKGQTLMAKLTQLYDKFINKTYGDNLNEIVTGATFSSNAVSNSVFVALELISRIGG